MQCLKLLMSYDILLFMQPDSFSMQFPILTAVTRFRRMHPGGLYRVHPGVWVLIVGTDGGAVVNRGESQFSVGPRDVLLYPPGELVDCRLGEAHQDWHHRWVAFHPHVRLEPLLEWPQAGSGPMWLHVGEDYIWDRVFGELDELHAALHHASPPRGLDLCFNLLENVLLWLEAANPDVHQPAADPRVLRATRYMAEHYPEKITVADLARQCRLSNSRFAHLFNEITGTPPMQYLEGLRIEHAKRLLLSTQDTLARIARACGFCNEFYFSNVFARRVGRRPTEFRDDAAAR